MCTNSICQRLREQSNHLFKIVYWLLIRTVSTLGIYSKFHMFQREQNYNYSYKMPLQRQEQTAECVYFLSELLQTTTQWGSHELQAQWDYKCFQELMSLTTGFNLDHFSLMPQKGQCLVFNCAVSVKLLFSS